MSLADITGVTNLQLWDLARKVSPSFKSHTAKGTADLFTERGFEALKLSDVTAINEFFEISLRVAFQKLSVSRAKNLFENSGLVQVYDTPNGGYTQRMAIYSVKPTTPQFHGLQNGGSVDPFRIRLPKADERFFATNFSFQSFITIQDFQVKQIFISQYGMGEFIAGIMQGLENGYKIQKSVNTKEAINAALNSTTYALQDTQVIDVAWADAGEEPTDAMMTGYLLAIKDLVTAMTTTEQTSAYNALKFATSVDTSDLVMVARAGIKNRIQLGLEVGAFNPDRLAIPVDEILEVDNFGGLVPYVLSGSTHVPVQPIYDTNGEQVAYVDASVTVNGPARFDAASGKWIVSVTSGGTTADTNQTIFNPDGYDDPNADVLAIIAQKGLLFENRQNPYEISPIYNPAGLYTNYWASSPNNSIVVDPLYTMVVIRGDASLTAIGYPKPVEVINSTLTVEAEITNGEDNPVPTQEVTPTEGE